MDILTKQKIEKQELSIFLRDLSADVNTNLKHMIEDMYKEEETEKVNKKSKKGKTHVKKKDLIIQQQNEKRKVKDIEDDINRVDYFLKIVDKNDPFIHLKKFKSNEGKLKFKYELLKMLWGEDKKKYMKYIIILFYELKKKKQLEWMVKIRCLKRLKKLLKSVMKKIL